jgi:hypothetical protein
VRSRTEPDADCVSRTSRPIRIERTQPERLDSLRAAAHAVSSPRVWAILGAVSGWAFAGAVYVAGTARQSDVVTLQTDLRNAIAANVAANATAEQHATEAGRRALAVQDSSALAFRTLTGACARARGGSSVLARDREENAAETRYDRALADGVAMHVAIRKALE